MNLPNDMMLKTAPGPFRAVWRGEKLAEFRKNDRDFQVNDRILLVEHDGERWLQPYRSVLVRVTHIASGGTFGIPVGFAMLSFVVVLRKVGSRGVHSGHRSCTGC